MQCVVGFFQIQRSKHQKYLQQVCYYSYKSKGDQINIFPIELNFKYSLLWIILDQNKKKKIGKLVAISN